MIEFNTSVDLDNRSVANLDDDKPGVQAMVAETRLHIRTRKRRPFAGSAGKPETGSPARSYVLGYKSVLPMHGSRHELPKGTVEAIKKDLNLK